jgi:Cu/Ag efflux protein CusF
MLAVEVRSMSSRRFASSLVLALAVAGCSMFGGGQKEPVSGVYSENQVTATATVQKIDSAKRLVTLKGDDSGNVVVIKAGDEVKNFAQINVGDRVRATYYQSIAYEVHKPGTLEDTSTKGVSGVGAAPPGAKPGAVAADVIRLTATIVSIDKKTPSVTLRTEDGNVTAVKVLHPEKLDEISVGDVAEIWLTQAVAITVEEAN